MSDLTNAQADAAEEIKALICASDAAALESIEKALEAGRKLVAAKADCPHGSWLPFLERVGIHERQARRLMQLARSGFESDTVSDLGGIKASLRFLALHEKCRKIVHSTRTPAADWKIFLQLIVDGDMDGANAFARERFDPRAFHHDLDVLRKCLPLLAEIRALFDDEQTAQAA